MTRGSRVLKEPITGAPARRAGRARSLPPRTRCRGYTVIASFSTLLAGLVLVASLTAAAPEALAGPMVAASVGGTAAVVGEPNEGGVSLGLSALWPFDPYFAFGPALFADDLGTGAERLTDPNDHTDLGAVAGIHRSTVGGAWRLDAWLPVGGSWSPFASGSWGLYHVTDDHLGTRIRSTTATGFSLGAGLTYRLSNALAVGPSVRYHRLFNDQVGRYVGITLDANWRLGK